MHKPIISNIKHLKLLNYNRAGCSAVINKDITIIAIAIGNFVLRCSYQSLNQLAKEGQRCL